MERLWDISPAYLWPGHSTRAATFENPSVRGTGQTSDEVIGVGRLERVADGLATVAIEVWSGAALVAIGVSSSTLLARK